MKISNDFSELLSKTQFMINPNPQINTPENSKNVIKDLETTSGSGHFILRRIGLSNCIFYDSTTHLCSIHENRPQACRNFPFSFNFIGKNKPLVVTWVNLAENFCPGIGSGTEYKHHDLELIGKKTNSLIEEYNNIISEINLESEKGNPLTPQEALMTIFLVAQKKADSYSEVKEIL